MNRYIGATAIVAAVLLAACGKAPTQTLPAASVPAINVSGTVARPPSTTCPTGEACDPPNSASVLIFTRAGQPDISTPIDARGAFALHLDPGTYALRVGPPPASGRIQPGEVRVPSTGTVRILVTIG